MSGAVSIQTFKNRFPGCGRKRSAQDDPYQSAPQLLMHGACVDRLEVTLAILPAGFDYEQLIIFTRMMIPGVFRLTSALFIY